MNQLVKIEDIHEAFFEYGQGDSYLTFPQAWAAKDWMKRHLLHIFNLTKDLEEGYPPTLQEDKDNPAIWKAEHWFWFLENFIKK